MKTVIHIFLAFILSIYSHSSLVSAPSGPTNPKDNEKEIKAKFDNFKKENGKAYSPDVETLRVKNFKDNLVKIEQHNKKNKDYTLGITPFADLTESQFQKQYLMSINQNRLSSSSSSLPTVGAVTAITTANWTNRAGPVRNQGSCGSCWTFSVVGSIQINQRIKKSLSTTKDYSEQQVVDCCTGPTYWSSGCNGGYPSEAFTYLVGGLATQSNYPYRAISGNCLTTVSKTDLISGFRRFSGASNALTVLATGTASVIVDAGKWSLYRSGVFSCTSVSYNHAVVLVGVSVNRFWIIRNSWGTRWGEIGYMRLGYSFTASCGLTQYIQVPTLR